MGPRKALERPSSAKHRFESHSKKDSIGEAIEELNLVLTENPSDVVK